MVLVSTTNGFKFELNQLNHLKHAQYSQVQSEWSEAWPQAIASHLCASLRLWLVLGCV